MEEDIKILEEKIKALNLHINNYYKNDCETSVCKELVKEKKAIENLIKGYKVEKLRNTLDEQSLKEALENYIPKSKVKEKIEELDKKILEYEAYRETGKETDEEYYDFIANSARKKVLQELMGEK